MRLGRASALPFLLWVVLGFGGEMSVLSIGWTSRLFLGCVLEFSSGCEE